MLIIDDATEYIAHTPHKKGITEDGKSALRIDEKIITDPCSFWESGTGNYSVQTVGTGCHAKGESSVAEGDMSFAGVDDIVEDWREGKAAHAEGGNTTAAGNYSHAEGNSTATNNPFKSQECFEIMQNGDIYIFGIGGYDGTNPETH